MHQSSLVGGIDGAIRQIILMRQSGGGEKLSVVHATDGPDPLAVRLGAHAEPVKCECALESGRLGNRRYVGLGGFETHRRNHRRLAQLFGRQLAIKTELGGDGFKQRTGFVRLAQFAQ